MNLICDCDSESTCTSLNVDCIAESAVDNALCIATKLIESDPERVFLYKRPTENLKKNISPLVVDFEEDEVEEAANEDNSPPLMNGDSASSSTINKYIEWTTIGDFTMNEVMNQIREYVAVWHLTPATKCVLVTPRDKEEMPPKGTRYFVDVLFSKPTAMCPNPLAVAAVNFYVNVSSIMPKDFPVMVTYRFEGYKTLFYTIGERTLRSFSFQRFFIDTILQVKLSFYAEICEYRNPAKKESWTKEPDFSDPNCKMFADELPK